MKVTMAIGAISDIADQSRIGNDRKWLRKGTLNHGAAAIGEKSILNSPNAPSTRHSRYPAAMPIRIGISWKMPLRRFMQATITQKVKSAIKALFRVWKSKLGLAYRSSESLIPTPVRLSPMITITGPVTTGGKIFRMNWGPASLATSAKAK